MVKWNAMTTNRIAFVGVNELRQATVAVGRDVGMSANFDVIECISLHHMQANRNTMQMWCNLWLWALFFHQFLHFLASISTNPSNSISFIRQTRHIEATFDVCIVINGCNAFSTDQKKKNEYKENIEMFVNVFQVRLYLCCFICNIHLICVVNQIQFMQLRLYLPFNSTSGSTTIATTVWGITTTTTKNHWLHAMSAVYTCNFSK